MPVRVRLASVTIARSLFLFALAALAEIGPRDSHHEDSDAPACVQEACSPSTWPVRDEPDRPPSLVCQTHGMGVDSAAWLTAVLRGDLPVVRPQSNEPADPDGS